jgi:hypothetical protein
MGDNLYENVGNLVALSFISSISIGLGLFFYAVFNDYVYYNLNIAVTTLESSGLIGEWVNAMMESFQNTILVLLPNTLDLLWAGTFLLFVYSFFQASYYAKREGYFGVLGFMTFGIMGVLFILGIFETLTNWFQTEFIAKVIPTLIYSTPLFNLYISNLGLVNLSIIAIAVVLNFVDLDINKFNFRKNKEAIQNEIS